MTEEDGPPKVSVLLAVYDGQAYVESAVRSMMAQTLRDIEIVVVDDGSTDDTPAILARLAAEDSRLRVLRPSQNLRLPRALNFELEHVRGTHVARMDADDLSLPHRLERQAAYLDANPGGGFWWDRVSRGSMPRAGISGPNPPARMPSRCDGQCDSACCSTIRPSCSAAPR